MADNGQSTNNGRTPFRRYVPAEDLPNPLRGAPPDTSAVSMSASGESELTTRSAQRAERNRWRQWVKPETSSEPPIETPSAKRIQYQPPSLSARGRESFAAPNPSPGEVVPLPKSPVMPSSTVRPLPDRERVPDPNVTNARSASVPVEKVPQAKPTAPVAKPARSPIASTANKVTPLRRKRVWASPPESIVDPVHPRRDRPPRRPARRTPRPILYTIRLLILGTGVAAIAGTALSSLKPPEQTVSEVTAPVNPAATPEKPGRQGLSSTLTLPLPLAEELVSLETDLVGLEAMTPGLTQATFFYDLDTGNYIDINGTQAISAASTIKLPVLVALLEAVDAGTISLQQPLTLREDLVAGGSGDMQTYEVGSQYTVLEVATQMIVHSDNTATNLVIDALGGIGLINQRFKAWGLEHTILKNLLPDLDGTNTTSPADLVRVLALVDQGEILGMRSRDRLFSILQRTYNRSLIPEGLADESAIAYNKTGDIGTMLGDIALLDMTNGKRYILGILVTRPYNDGRANELIRRVAGRVHEEMNQSPQPAGVANPPTPASPSVTPSTAPDPDSPTSSQTDVDVQITPVDSVPNPADSLPDEYLIPEDDVYSDPQLPPEGGGF